MPAQGHSAVKEISRAAVAERNSKDGFARGADGIVWGHRHQEEEAYGTTLPS